MIWRALAWVGGSTTTDMMTTLAIGGKIHALATNPCASQVGKKVQTDRSCSRSSCQMCINRTCIHGSARRALPFISRVCVLWLRARALACQQKRRCPPMADMRFSRNQFLCHPGVMHSEPVCTSSREVLLFQCHNDLDLRLRAWELQKRLSVSGAMPTQSAKGVLELDPGRRLHF